MDAWVAQLRRSFAEAPAKPLHQPPPLLRQSAVLVPILNRAGEPFIVFTQRPNSLRTHGGQISFPGGTREPDDAEPLQTALREAEEELGLPSEQVEVLGALDEVQTLTHFRIWPFAGLIPPHFQYQLQPAEVESVLEASVRKLLDPTIHRLERMRVLDEEREVDFYQYGPHVIWGATARILRDLLQRLGTAPGLKARNG